MKLHEIRPAKGAVHKEKRIGRGEASGKGGTSTKGNKGAQQRAGYASKMAFEGGQMPIQRRLPKRGFKNPHRVEYKVFNLGQVAQIAEKYGIEDFSMENLYVNGRYGNCKVACILADFFPATISFFLKFLKRRVKDSHQLHKDRSRDVRHDTKCQDRSLGKCTACEGINQTQYSTFICSCSINPAWVDTGKNNMSS